MADGKPVAGARVRVEQQLRYSRHYLGTDEISTDENGRFVVAPIGPNELYVVSVITDATVPRPLVSKVVEVGGELTSADAGTINLAPRMAPRRDNANP